MAPQTNNETNGKDQHNSSADTSTSTDFANSPVKVGIIDAMIDENSVELQPVSNNNDGLQRRRPSPKDMDEGMRMSKVSDLYDVERKGYLDAAQMEMRRLDSQNQGFLDNSKVYEIMSSLQLEQKKSAALIESLQKEHQKAMSLKRGIIYMSFFAFLLALTNIGTSFAAARLAKDISTSQEDLIDKETGVRVGTTSKSVVLQVTPVEVDFQDEASRSRHSRFLQDAIGLSCPELVTDKNYTGTDWETGSVGNSTLMCRAVGHIDYEDAESLYKALCPQYMTDAFNENGVASCVTSLAEVLLTCGTRSTRVLGGGSFPRGGEPGMELRNEYFVFPAPVIPDMIPTGSLYFQGLQMVDEPAPATAQFSLTANALPTTRCEEYFQFKLYCDPNLKGTGQTCLLIESYMSGQRKCAGFVQMCQAETATSSARRARLRSASHGGAAATSTALPPY